MAVPENQMQHSLRFGDVILLYSKEGRGYVFSETSSSAHLTLSVLQDHHVISPNNFDIPDIRMAAFKVLAQNKSTAQERLGNVKKKQLQNRDATNDVELQNAKKNANNELKNNELEQERQKGTTVPYGSVIQLQHIFSKKYVAINTIKTSKTENTNLQMYLLDHDSKNCLFKILPRYKVRSVGDEVRIEDQVIFAIEKTEGQYIHTSSRTYGQVGITLHEHNYEINASATESGYTIKSHYRAMPKEQESVKGGSIIRLFHRELEFYLVAEGSFANESDDKAVVEEVHLRKRKSEHGKLKAPSTSSITYWQIEKDEKPLSGQVVSWGERCRIKHLPTRLYLAIVKGESGCEVKLKKRDISSVKADLDIVFRLFPVIEEDTGIMLNSYARINHPHTKTWLVAKKGEHYIRKAFDPNASGIASLKWDSAELLKIGVQDQMSYDDAFTIEKVDEELIRIFTYIASFVPIIKAYIKELNSNLGNISVKKVDAVRKELEELAYFIKHAYPKMKDYQKLLRNLMVLEMVKSILEKFDDHNAHYARIHRPVCQACYNLIEVYLLGQSRKNENYLARFITFFEGQIGMNLNAEQMLTELVRDNALIISKFGDKELDSIINKLVTTKDPRFFDYLGVLCVCKNRPNPENQDSIIDKLVRKYGKDLFYLTEVHDIAPCEASGASSNKCHNKTKEILYCVPSGSIDEWHPLSNIASLKNSPKDIKQKQQYQYLLAQLDLFGKLCKGNNAEAVRIIDVEFNYLTFEEALVGAQDSDLHPALRSKYVELIVVLYVDVGDNRPILDNLPLSFVYNEISKDAFKSTGPTASLTTAINIHFPVLKEWIQLHVKDIQSVVANVSMIDENNLNAEVLDLLYLLVKYGYYDDLCDINELIPPLVSLLNGQNDNSAKEGRFEDTRENRPVFKMKIKALKTMDLFFNYRFYIRLQHFIYDYKLLNKDINPNEDLETKPNEVDLPPIGKQQFVKLNSAYLTQQVAHVRQHVSHQMGNFPLTRARGNDDHSLEQPPEQLKRLKLESHCLEIHNDEQLMDLAVKRLDQIFSRSHYRECDLVDTLKEGTCFPEILIDLSQYQNDELLHESLHLLGRFFSAEENLFEKAIQTQLLITSESQRVHAEVLSKLPTLRHYAELDIKVEQNSELGDILYQLTRLCHLEGDENQPHKQNQKILYNTGVFSDILNLIFRDKSCSQFTTDGVKIVGNLDQAEMEVREHILAKCLEFLEMLARDNVTVQERLLDRMDDLLKLDVAIPKMADVLSEVFTGGQELCLKIKEKQVERVFILIRCIHSDRKKGCAELLGMLQAVVKVEDLDLPLKRNQAYIIKYFSKTRDKFCNDLLGLEENKVKRRSHLLIQAENSDSDLQMLLRVIDLLASCAEGENLFIESICQSLIGISELLQILSMQDLNPVRKKPFVRFLLWVYMNTGGDKIQTGSTMLFHDWQMWSYLEHTNLILEGVVKALNNLPPNEIPLAKSSLTSRSLRISQNKQSIRRTKTISTTRNIPYVTDKDGNLIPGLLLYLMDGVIPVLKVYYAEYFIPCDTSAETTGDSSKIASPEKEIQVSAAIGRSLMCLADVIKKLLTSQEQWDLLYSTLITIIRQPCFDEHPLEIDPEIKRRFDNSIKFNFTAPNDALKKYDSTYCQENELNEEFNKFVRNYELAYWGPNTASYQIGSSYDIDYNDNILDPKEGEWLPLGKSFQKHVKLYMSDHFPEVTINKPFAKRIIDCLESSYNNLADLDEKERQRQDRNDIRYLQLLRALIHNQVMFVDRDLREEGKDPKRFRLQWNRVKSVQKQIQELGNTVERVVKLLTHPNEKISAEVLAFLSMLLCNGNETVQNGFSYLMNTREEKLFISMQQRFQQAALNDCERRMLLAQHESRITSQKFLKNTYISRSARKDSLYPTAYITESARKESLLPTAYITESARKESLRPTAKEVLSPDLATYSSTSTLLDENRKSSVFSDERVDFSTTQQLVKSDKAYEMEIITEAHYEDKTHSIHRIGTWKLFGQRRPILINEELSKEPGQVETEIHLQKSYVEDDIESKRKRRGSNNNGKKASSLQFKDTSHIELALRVLGSMCDGQYRPMQNYLREQPDNIKTINLVLETCTFLSSFYVDVTNDNIVLINSVLQTLIEMSVGNFKNQEILFNHQIIDIINCILQITVVHHCPLEKVLELKQTAIELLEVMCEETHTGTAKLVQSIYKVVDLDALRKTLAYFYILSQDPKMKQLEKDDDAERAAFRTYHVLIHLVDFEGISLTDISPITSDIEPKSKNVHAMGTNRDNDLINKAWEHCKKSSKSIEVLYKSEDEDKYVLAKVHFRSYPSDKLPEELIERVKYQVNRDSPEDKTRDFLKWMKAAKKEIFYLNELRKHWYTHYLFVYNIKLRNYLLIFWTLLMNILLMIAWSDVDIKLDLMSNPPENETIYCMEDLCRINRTNSSDCKSSNCEMETCVPTIPDIDNYHWFFDNLLYLGGTIHLVMSLAMAVSYFLINAKNFVLPDFVYRSQKEKRIPTYSDEPLFGIRALYHIMFVTCSVLSMSFYGYFYCICLLHIVIDNDILQRVLRSVTKNGRSLLWVGALGLVILYIYSVGTFAFLRNEFHEPDGDNVRFCQSLFQCYISVIEYGLLDTLGSVADLPNNFTDAALRAIFFDLTFFIIVSTIGLNIVFGIIVDTFSELRDEKWRIDEDKKEKCFICSLASYEFERRADGFDRHVKDEHCMWNYIYYYTHLERIDTTSHNAIESYVYQQIRDSKTDFFPLFHAKNLKPKSDVVLAKLNDLEKMVAEIMKRFKDEERATTLRRKLEEQAQWEKENQ